MLGPLAAGLLTGLSLIVAIGAQNAYVLRQGLARQHVLAVVSICAVSDAVLIVAGVLGIGAIVERASWALDVVLWLGVAFLVWYGVASLLRALRTETLEAARAGAPNLRSAVLRTLALTWLNPHVYLDTVLLLGSIGNQQGPDGRWWFALGAAAGSVLWFTALGYGAAAGQRLLATARAWKVLDVLIGLTMFGIAGTLALG